MARHTACLASRRLEIFGKVSPHRETTSMTARSLAYLTRSQRDTSRRWTSGHRDQELTRRHIRQHPTGQEDPNLTWKSATGPTSSRKRNKQSHLLLILTDNQSRCQSRTSEEHNRQPLDSALQKGVVHRTNPNS